MFKEIIGDLLNNLNLKTDAATILQNISEDFLNEIMQCASDAAHHDGRITIMPKDIKLVCSIKFKNMLDY